MIAVVMVSSGAGSQGVVKRSPVPVETLKRSWWR